MTAVPRLSVVMPCYNTERYVEEAARSILAQTFTDFEFLALDDGSTDRTLAILKRLAAEDSRLQVIALPHAGLVATLNAGIERARASWIARMDADDVCLPQRFARQVAYLDAHPDVIALGTSFIRIDADGLPFSRPRAMVYDHAAIEAALARGRNTLVHPAMIFSRELCLAAGGYREEGSYFEDYGLWLRMMPLGRFANLPDELVLHRRHLQSITAGSRQGRRARPGASVVASAHAAWAATALRDGYRAAARKHSRLAWWHRKRSGSYFWLMARAWSPRDPGRR